ncbi:MAG: hypothetical protein Q9201_006841, partial [Fulgogasparrea decipioides]
MAPVDDEFVLTISDHDDVESPPEDDGEPTQPRAAGKLSGKKRKRGDEGGHSMNGASVNGRRKTSKRQKKKNESVESDDDALEDEEEQSWAAGGKDDGAMNSDFEFQVQGADGGLTEDFDAWDIDVQDRANGGHGPKKGVDIDELIARRRQGRKSEGKINGVHEDGRSGEEDAEDESEDLGLGAEGSGSLDEEEVGEEGRLEEDEDETLATDGFGMGVTGSDEESESADANHMDEAPGNDSEDESVAEPVPHPDDEASDTPAASDDDDPNEKTRREAFFAPEEEIKGSKPANISSNAFQNMSLSRPILRGLASVGFSTPTPIQTKTIPIALLGKDVVGGAVTGSGKTAAFIVPILERLLYRPKRVPTSRVAILMPTRELAVQCFNVAQKLASFTDITFCQLVGGFSLREQENVLRTRPDVIIATPGRFIDHMRNSASFTVDTLEILVLDEADRMLEDGFADELNEILTTIPKRRQTMLFSATMTSRVDQLIRIGLQRPVRLLINLTPQTVTTLTQEFVRLRPGREDKRLGYLLHLCTTVFTDRVIIFFRQKKLAHRVRIIFSLFDIKTAELHGNMSQEQRLSALTSFKEGKVSHLLATDVASRGLDIRGVDTVLNFGAPQNLNIYLHRVGRTARAGAVGRACTIAAEEDRKVVKAAVKSARAQGAKVASRTVNNELVDAWQVKVDEMEGEVDAILKEEKEEKAMGEAERDVRKGENLVDYEKEIRARPKRTWFESEREKRIAKKSGAVELNGVQGNKRGG